MNFLKNSKGQIILVIPVMILMSIFLIYLFGKSNLLNFAKADAKGRIMTQTLGDNIFERMKFLLAGNEPTLMGDGTGCLKNKLEDFLLFNTLHTATFTSLSEVESYCFITSEEKNIIDKITIKIAKQSNNIDQLTARVQVELAITTKKYNKLKRPYTYKRVKNFNLQALRLSEFNLIFAKGTPIEEDEHFIEAGRNISVNLNGKVYFSSNENFALENIANDITSVADNRVTFRQPVYVKKPYLLSETPFINSNAFTKGLELNALSAVKALPLPAHSDKIAGPSADELLSRWKILGRNTPTRGFYLPYVGSGTTIVESCPVQDSYGSWSDEGMTISQESDLGPENGNNSRLQIPTRLSGEHLSVNKSCDLGTNKNLVIFSEPDKEYTIDFTENSYDRYFCGIVNAKKIHIKLRNTQNTQYYLVGKFITEGITISGRGEGNGNNGKGHVNFYDILQIDASFPLANTINTNILRNVFLSHSSALAKNFSLPLFKEYTSFNFNEPYLFPSSPISNPDYFVRDCPNAFNKKQIKGSFPEPDYSALITGDEDLGKNLAFIVYEII